MSNTVVGAGDEAEEGKEFGPWLDSPLHTTTSNTEVSLLLGDN